MQKYVLLRAAGSSILSIFLLFVPNTFGDTVSAPCSYRVFSKDEKFFFVMLAPNDKKGVECYGYSDTKKTDAMELRKRFSVSGLYTEGRSRPLWRVDWYASQLYIANDGKHLVRIGPWASNPSDEAISFIENGKILKTYTIEDLIRKIENLPHSTSHFEWKKEFDMNNDTMAFSLVTLQGRKFTFSLETGEILNKDEGDTSSTQPENSFCLGALLLIGFASTRLYGR